MRNNMRNKVLLFNKSNNTTIKDSSLTVSIGTTKRGNLDLLFDTVSLNAILNAGGRADEVRCYPGTREEIIQKVEKWMDGQSEADRPILWLTGHAGAGKFAITQTVVERGAEEGAPAANFFFFRGDNTRNHERPLVATLVYQLINCYPALRKQLTNELAAQPLTHKASVGEQFTRLLTSPIENVHHAASINRKITLIIDGLDECDDDAAQVRVLSAIHSLVSRGDSPFRVLVASRAEPHLVMFFNKIAGSVESLFINDEYRPQDDIRNFVTAKFDDIKRTHHLAHSVDNNWPAEEDIDKIICKSSGQFIYPATVMRFIEYSKDSPVLSLLTVLQMRPTTNHSPFTQLDALYSHVFAKARDIHLIKRVFGLQFMGLDITGPKVLRILGYETIYLQSMFADISALAQIYIDHNDDYLHVEFYHASLPDYLKDKSRSNIYHVDEAEIAEDLSACCLQRSCDPVSFNCIVNVMKVVQKPTARLSQSLLDATKRKFDGDFGSPICWAAFIGTIFQLYFRTDKVLCARILRSWVCFAYAHKIDTEVDYSDLDIATYTSYQLCRLTAMSTFVFRRGWSR